MANYKPAAIGLALAFIGGCSTNLELVSPNDALPGYFPVSSGAPVPYLFQGSAVQWNRHYAVSAAHIPLLANVVHRCSSGCDLVFIRRDADGPLPTWRPSVVGEPLETVGQSPLLLLVKGSGTSRAQKVLRNKQSDTTAYAINDAPVVEGMSGGPVYGKDRAVVGMTVGIFQPQVPLPAPLQNKKLSVYVPYEIVQREWQLFMERQNARLPRQDKAQES